MCRLLLIGSDQPLPPLEPWREGTVISGGDVPRAHLGARVYDDSAMAEAARTFAKKHVVYVGSHEGCGCGFRYDAADEEVEDEAALRRTWLGTPADLEVTLDGARGMRESSLKGRASVAALCLYLEKATSGGPVELMCVWDGIWPPEKEFSRGSLRPDDFANDLAAFEVPLWSWFVIHR